MEVAHIAFTVDARAAGRAGIPAEVALGAAGGLFGERLAMEAWIDAESLPRRIAFVLHLEPESSNGRLILPARTVTGVYDLKGFGEPVPG